MLLKHIFSNINIANILTIIIFFILKKLFKNFLLAQLIKLSLFINALEVTMDVEKFLSKLIIHIPPKNFKMIRRFGIYSRNIKMELKFIISRMKKYKSQYTKTTFYQLEIWKTFGINPFYCLNCKIKMKVRRISYFNISTSSICWKKYRW